MAKKKEKIKFELLAPVKLTKAEKALLKKKLKSALVLAAPKRIKKEIYLSIATKIRKFLTGKSK